MPAIASRVIPSSASSWHACSPRRVDVMTGYLADLRHQYGDHEGGLGMIDEVLASLSHSPRVEVDPGSERETDAPY